jgi:Fibronectin type III-like domain
VAQLLGFQRVSLAPGEAARVLFRVPTGRLAFSGRDLVRVVEPGQIELWVGRSCIERAVESVVELVGPPHMISGDDPRWVDVTVTSSPRPSTVSSTSRTS